MTTTTIVESHSSVLLEKPLPTYSCSDFGRVYAETQCRFRAGRSTIDGLLLEAATGETQRAETAALSRIRRPDQGICPDQQEKLLQSAREYRMSRQVPEDDHVFS